MADDSWTSSPEAPASTNLKRNATAAGNSSSTNFRAVKRRASKACQCCRARKVRCNVIEHGAPCTNCRLDEVECIITESKRRKKFWGAKIEAAKDPKTSPTGESTQNNISTAFSSTSKPRREPTSVPIATAIPHSPEDLRLPDIDRGGHMPHFIYQHAQSHLGEEMEEFTGRPSYAASNASVPSLSYSASAPSSTASSFPHYMPHRSRAFELPSYIKSSPARMPIEDIEFLARKGALRLPDEQLRNALLKAHFKFVHPFMPLLNKREFMEIVTGVASPKKKIGLLLFQAVMFTGSAFVDMELLRAAGYHTRKSARKAFFQKTRLLYDFDHEPDRMPLVQSLLLMTYWYETPDDQKDTWHWMGVAISLAHTIGLHRNPEKSMALDSRSKKLWKRVWWSCVMRDRLVALGMRRPTRIKEEDCDVPMLELEDFEIDMDITHIPLLSEGEDYEESMFKQRQLAVMCIEKAKLCVCISNVLTAQYSVLNTNQGGLAADGSTKTTMVLLPKGEDKDTCEVESCDRELQEWIDRLPEMAMYRPMRIGDEPLDEGLGLHRNLLHMVYFTTVSALHRPQVLPSAPAPWPSRNANAALQERSRLKVREAASEITRLATELIEYGLVRYLPTTGVTVMLPAIIIHLLDIKSSNSQTRERSVEGFSICMQVMQGLRVSYASADYATHFLEAAIKKADIQVANTRRWAPSTSQQQSRPKLSAAQLQRVRRRRPSRSTNPRITNINNNVVNLTGYEPKALTPPPDYIAVGEDGTLKFDTGMASTDDTFISTSITVDKPTTTFSSNLTNLDSVNNTNDNANTTMDDDTTLQLKLESFLATTPPPPSSTHSAEDIDCEMLDTGSPDMLFSATTPPPVSISIPRAGDEDYYGQQINGDNSPIDAILGKDIDPFLGHYEEGAELSLRGMGGSGGKFGYSSSWAGFGRDDLLNGGRNFGNGGWMEGGVDMESVGKLLDGVDFELEDVIQVLENEIN